MDSILINWINSTIFRIILIGLKITESYFSLVVLVSSFLKSGCSKKFRKIPRKTPMTEYRFSKVTSSRMFSSELCGIFQSSYSAERLLPRDSRKGSLIESAVVFFENLKFKDLRPQACNFIKKEGLAQVFSCEFCEIFKNTFFIEHLRWLLLYVRSCSLISLSVQP